jgi:peptidyl-prolyl cis-trans isomerase B (cyclophilin B)
VTDDTVLAGHDSGGRRSRATRSTYARLKVVNVKRLTILAAAAILLASGCAPALDPPTDPGDGPTTRSNAKPGFANCDYVVSGNAAQPVDPPPTEDVPATGTTTVTLTMNEGPVTITLDRARTPCTVNSFLSLLEQGFYTGTKCHRLADSGSLHMLQCGDPTGTGRGGPGYTYADETYADDTYPAGVVAMANAGPNTNGSQFFFVYEASSLRPDYTVFGYVDEASLGVIERIAANGQDGSGSDGTGRPNNAAEIERVSVG